MKLKELIKNIIMYSAIGLIGIFVLFLIVINVWGLIENEKEDNYCESIYLSSIKEPSVFSNSWSETSRVEDGYLRYCRYYWEEHEKKSECQIFPYIKQNH